MRAVSSLPVQRVPAKNASSDTRKVVVLSSADGYEISNILELPAKRLGFEIVLKNVVDSSTLEDLGLQDIGIVDLSRFYSVSTDFEKVVRAAVHKPRVHLILNHHSHISGPQAAHIRTYYGELSRSRRIWQGPSALQREIGRILA